MWLLHRSSRMTSTPKLWQMHSRRASCSAYREGAAMDAGPMPALLFCPYKDASTCILAEGIKPLCCLQLQWNVPSQLCLLPSGPAARHAGWGASIRPEQEVTERPWVWDWVAPQPRGSCGNPLPGSAFLQMPGLVKPSPAGRIQSTKY